ncbi:MAG: conjugal transfer protein TrbE [Zavarzinia sp.]|nr:conjugal transfer protein TrbE [Zavarzinia sp.]
MMNLAEYRRKSALLSDLLPWAALIGPGLVLAKDGTFLRVIKFRGPDLASSTKPQLVAARARLNNAIRRLGSGWALWIEARRQPTFDYPASSFPDPITRLIDAERRAMFQAETADRYESEYFLTLAYQPPEERISKAEALVIENAQAGDRDAFYVNEKVRFENTVNAIADILAGFMPHSEILGDTAVLSYLYACATGRLQPFAAPDVPMYLDAMLGAATLVGGLEPRLDGLHMRTIGITNYPSQTVPGLLDALNEMPIAYRWVTRYIPLDKVDAEKAVTTIRKNWFAKRKGIMTMLREALTKSESALENSDAINKAADADAALQVIGADLSSFGYITPTITIMDTDVVRLNGKLRAITSLLAAQGFTARVEDMNAVEAWLSSLPGHGYANCRKPPMSSLNLADLMPLSSIWAGPERNTHLDGPALMLTRTTGSTPFRFDLHQGDVGHSIIIGPTGAGKSVLLNFIATQFRRYPGAQVFMLDNGRSSAITTALVGGQFYALGTTGPQAIGFQPLARIHEDGERTWALEWLVAVVTAQGVPVTPDIKAEIWAALNVVAARPVDQRTLTFLRTAVQSEPVKAALHPFTLEGPHGDLLDADTEATGTASWQAFDMQALYERGEKATGAVLAYLFHHIARHFDGSPTVVIVDEGWSALDNPIFERFLAEYLRTARRQNVAVVFATQALEDVATAKISHVLTQQCPTRIFLPNDNAQNPTTRPIYEAFGLNDRQIQILAQAIPKRQYYYQSSAGNRLFELALSRFAVTVCGSSSKADLAVFDQLVAEHGPQTGALAFLSAKGFTGADIAQMFDAYTHDFTSKAAE